MVDDQNDRQQRLLGRRRLLRAGAVAAPVVLTLRARPASAQINPAYANRPYQYGIHAGMTSTELNALRQAAAGDESLEEQCEGTEPFGGHDPFGKHPFGGPGPYYDGNPFGGPPDGDPFGGDGF